MSHDPCHRAPRPVAADLDRCPIGAVDDLRRRLMQAEEALWAGESGAADAAGADPRLLAEASAVLEQISSRYRHAEESRVAAQRELQKLNDQFLQAQKLEAVGRLAGGVAHDFNNLLTAINGFCDLLLAQVEEGSPAELYAQEIRSAGERASQLTRQLLTFGRRPLRRPELFVLDDRLRGLELMLRRTIGEDIQLVTRLDAPETRVYADPNHVEQALVNLVVNARDAMPGGGRLDIWTQRVERLPAAVLLAVRDTGQGMDPEVLAHAFEPFFTTKETGKGSGLGLAAVYGIVEQSGGHVEVDSAPGSGTEMRLYWPVAVPAGAC